MRQARDLEPLEGDIKLRKQAPRIDIIDDAIIDGAPPARLHRLHALCASDVIVAGAKHFGLTPSDITGARRSAGIVRARNLIAMVLFARGNSYSSISRFLNRHHTTIMHTADQFFARDIHEIVSAEAWISMAPCVMAGARTLDELIAMRGGL